MFRFQNIIASLNINYFCSFPLTIFLFNCIVNLRNMKRNGEFMEKLDPINYKGMSKYLFILAISYYLLPCLIINTGIGMLVLLIFLPILSFVCSYLYGFKCSFQPLFSLFVILLYIPSVFIYYNSSAIVYSLMYGLLSFAGLFIGYQTSKK